MLNQYFPYQVDFSPVYLYDHQAIAVRKNSDMKNALDLQNSTIGYVADGITSLGQLENKLNAAGIEFTAKQYFSIEEVVDAFNKGNIDAFALDRAIILDRLSNPDNHRLLDLEVSKEPIALALPENDSQWADVVRWVNYVPMQAEELGITSQNIDEIIALNTDEDDNNDSSPAVRRFLGIDEDLGATLGLPKDFAANVIREVGNYEEIYQRHFSDTDRDRNLLWKDGGLLYSPPFSGSEIDFPINNNNRNVLDEILERGELKVGINGEAPGFSNFQNGELVGFDVDLGRALAAAVLGDEEAVKFTTQTNKERLSNVANGIVDVSANQTTHNLVRDAQLGVDFAPTYFYTGQGILVREGSGIVNLATTVNGWGL